MLFRLLILTASAILATAAQAAENGQPAAAQPAACLFRLSALEGDAFERAGAVGRWRDPAGDVLAVQPEPDLRPTFPDARARSPRPTVRFDGGDDFLAVSPRRDWSATDWTLFAVASLDGETPDNWRGIIGNRFGEGSDYWWTLGTASSGALYLELGAGNGVMTSFRVAGAGPLLFTVVKRGEEFELFASGASMGTARKDAVGDKTNELRLGRWFGEGQGWQGGIGEVRLYAGALDDGRRAAVEAAMQSDWRLLDAASLYRKCDTWAETLIATRASLWDAWERQLAAMPGATGPAVRVDGPHPAVHDVRGALWQQVAADFPRESAWFTADAFGGEPLRFFVMEPTPDSARALVGEAEPDTREKLEKLLASGQPPEFEPLLGLFLEAAVERRRYEEARRRLARVNAPALRRAAEDLARSFPDEYAGGPAYLERLDALAPDAGDLDAQLVRCEPEAVERAEQLIALQREILLSNPLLDFERLLVVKRSEKSPNLGLVNNWVSNCGLPRSGFDDEIATLDYRRPDAPLETLYEPAEPVFVGDVDLHFDGDRMLFSSIGSNNCWQIFEVRSDGSGLRQVTPGDAPDIDSYDACYLPDDRVLFTSNAYMAAVPCVNGGTRTATLYRLEHDGTTRQLTFDQEHNWCPTPLNNGRVLYLRWEYTDTPHSHDRVLFHMNPDGTGQMEYYGSNSYWPNSLFYARPAPNHPTRFFGIVSGHHGVPRMGELVLFDPALGRREADGAVQQIPGWGKKVEARIEDQLVDASWPKFLHPWPLSDKYCLVACKPDPAALWGVYLVDVFDNLLLLREEPGFVLFEPVPLAPQQRPPDIPDRADWTRDDALVYLSDVYVGDGLRGVPRGEVKSLRVFTYHFLYPGMGGPQAVVGMEGPWDIKRVLGSVPVEPDGSALFRVPANTPVAVQPLDKDGRALQLMRSWFTAMPGESVSCVGCHESQNTPPPVQATMASRRAPSEIEPWYGPARGFNFAREVQPVLDAYCVRCHDGGAGAQRAAASLAPAQNMPDLTGDEWIDDYTSVFHYGGIDAGHFTRSYAELHRYVRRPGLESDYRLLMPTEFHAATTQLVQMLEKGHHGVRLDVESWDRINTWIDLNAPFHGTWTEIAGEERVERWAARRRETLQRFAGLDDNPEADRFREPAVITPVAIEGETAGGAALGDAAPRPGAKRAGARAQMARFEGWPFSEAEAASRQASAAGSAGLSRRTVQVAEGVEMDLVLVPAGSFVMGSADGEADESPRTLVGIGEPFWMGRLEVTNEQFSCYDPHHDSRVEHRFSMQFGVRGFYVNDPGQPVVRVSWRDAMDFCEWLSERTGLEFSLPTEAQWEWACRAGSDGAFSFGDIDADFSSYANLADQKLREFVCHTYKKEREPWLHASKYDDWIPKDLRFNDGGFLSEPGGAWRPNAFGLCDMHGNVWEWTRSVYQRYPYVDDDGRNDLEEDGDRVARGGSWRDRPHWARSAFRVPYRPWQGVYNVGFRVVAPARGSSGAVAEGRLP